MDWGEKRFGIALSDPLRMIAQPLTTLTRRAGKRAPVRAIVALLVQYQAAEVVVGLPLTPEGDEGDAAIAARALGQQIAARSNLPVHFLDERMTTAHALKSARRAGLKDADSRDRIDQMAAVGILRAWLDQAGDRRQETGDRGSGGAEGGEAGDRGIAGPLDGEAGDPGTGGPQDR